MKTVNEASWYALSISVVAIFLAGCGGSQAPIGAPGVMPQASALAAHAERGRSWRLREVRNPTMGIYVSDDNGSKTQVLGYRYNNRKNDPPLCAVGDSDPGGVATDLKGNLIVLGQGASVATIFKGAELCGSELGAIAIPYDDAVDAASIDAVNGKIAIAIAFSNIGGPGSIAVCTLKHGCSADLTHAGMFEVGGVAMAKNGDCWASAIPNSGNATLTYFKACAGAGRRATGFQNRWYGGLDIDAAGNLVSVSVFDDKLYIYKGCNPTCELIGGPFVLEDETIYAHLNADATKLLGADIYNGIDIYKYSPTSLTYEYSFEDGLGDPYFLVDGAAYSPHSRE